MVTMTDNFSKTVTEYCRCCSVGQFYAAAGVPSPPDRAHGADHFVFSINPDFATAAHSFASCPSSQRSSLGSSSPGDRGSQPACSGDDDSGAFLPGPPCAVNTYTQTPSDAGAAKAAALAPPSTTEEAISRLGAHFEATARVRPAAVCIRCGVAITQTGGGAEEALCACMRGLCRLGAQHASSPQCGARRCHSCGGTVLQRQLRRGGQHRGIGNGCSGCTCGHRICPWQVFDQRLVLSMLHST